MSKKYSVVCSSTILVDYFRKLFRQVFPGGWWEQGSMWWRWLHEGHPHSETEGTNVAVLLCLLQPDSRDGAPRGATQTLGTEHGRGPEGSCTLSSLFAASTWLKVLWPAVQWFESRLWLCSAGMSCLQAYGVEPAGDRESNDTLYEG